LDKVSTQHKPCRHTSNRSLLIFFLLLKQTVLERITQVYVYCFHRFDDRFIPFMYHTVTHGQSTIDNLHILFFLEFILMTYTGIIRKKLLMTCLQSYTLSKNNIHFEEKEVLHSSSYSNVCIYITHTHIRVFRLFFFLYTK